MNPIPVSLTTPTVVLNGLAAACKQDVPNLSFIFSPVLSWKDVAEAQRAQRDMQADTDEAGAVPDQPTLDPTQFPLLAWNRSALITMEGMSRRNVHQESATVTLDDGTGNKVDWDLQAFLGMVRFHFKVFARDMLELEALELGYVTTTILSDITKITVPIPSLYSQHDFGDIPESFWDFDVQWDPLTLESLEVERRPAIVFAFQGSATVRGAFLTGSAVQRYPLRTINASIENMSQQLIDHIIVTRNN